MCMHTVAFHNIVMFEFILIIALGLHEPVPKGEQKTTILFVVFFCIVAAIMSQIFKTNYAGFYSCNIPVFETVRLSLRDSIGELAAQIFYVGVIAAIHVLFVWGSYWAYRGLRRIVNK